MKENDVSSGKLTSLDLILRALQYRNYRLFFGGQSISLIGTWMQRVAVSWLVYRLTNSAFLLGLVGFAGQIPTFLIAPIAGVVADRYNQHRILVITQTLLLMQALALWFLVITKTIEIWQIITLAMFMGFVNSFDMPTRQSFVVHMIEDRADLGNAIALNSTMVNIARLVGPSLAGILVAAAGEGICFLINAVSFLAVIASLLAMRITPVKIEAKKSHVLRELEEGFIYSLRTPPIRNTILLLALVSLMGMPYMVLMPVFARDILHGGPHTLGFLMAASGLGALMGALYLASRKSGHGLEKAVPIAAVTFGVGLITFGLSRVYVLSLIFLVVAGLGMMVQMASSNTILQVVVDDDKRARVMSFYTMAFMGMAPFGNLLAGAMAAAIGAPITTMICGACCILGALFYAGNIPVIKKSVDVQIPLTQ